MPLTHRHIDVFHAVMTSGSVTRAAAQLHTSQPTVSRDLAQLERVLGLTLFDRAKGRLRPTARALALLDEVQRSYIGLERIAAVGQSLRHFDQGQLRIASLPALAHGVLPRAMQLFCARFPQVAISVTPLESPVLEQSLTEQRFDLGLCELQQAPPGTSLTVLLRADEVCVLPEQHPLLRRRTVKPSDFAQQSFISLSPTDPYRRLLDDLFERQGVQRLLRLEAASAAAVCALVRQGLGVSIVNPLTAWEWAGHGLHVRPFAESITFTMGLVLPQHRPSNPLVDTFVECLQRAAARLGRTTKP